MSATETASIMALLKMASHVKGAQVVRLRHGRPEDQDGLFELLEQNGMAGEITPAECLMAEGAGGVIGFARIEIVDDLPYLRPIVIATQYRHQGIGRLLVKRLLSKRPELRVIARGEAVDFYTHLGFGPMAWEAVPPLYRRECENCPELSPCQPVPMRYPG